MDRYDPNEWTPSFVRENKSFCLSFLQDTNSRVIELLESGDYEPAVAGIDRMLNGAIVMQNAGVADMKPFLATNSFNQGIIVTCGLKSYPENKRRETALAAFSDARDFSTSDLRQISDSVIDMLRSGQSLSSVADEICPQFPGDVISLMRDTNGRLEKYKGSSSAGSSSSSSGGCYVATCVYGSYDCPPVWTLRRFRDYTLAKSRFGRAFIRVYYAVSPTLVKWFGHTAWFRNVCQAPLDRLVSKLHREGVADTPYDDNSFIR